MVFVDLETTGSTGTVDRITEIGIVEIHEDGEVREWSSLVNPQTSIPGFIQSLTGITNDMVAGAPTFAELADEVLSRLHGRLFVAHNARFDYGFLKSEFKRLGLDFKAPVLCTVKLSRRLFPQHSKGVYKGWADDALMAFVTHALKDAEDGGVELKCHPSREADIFSSAPDRLWGLLGKVRTPTMVLHAEKTFPFVTESVARWQAINEAVQALQVPGGHCFMQEQPEMAAQQVRAFLLPG